MMFLPSVMTLIPTVTTCLSAVIMFAPTVITTLPMARMFAAMMTTFLHYIPLALKIVDDMNRHGYLLSEKINCFFGVAEI